MQAELAVDLVAAGGQARSVKLRLVPSRDATQTAPAAADAALARLARDGDRDAFGRLYARYAAVVHGVLLARVPPSDADDLVQDVFVLAMEQLPGLRDPAAFGGWLMAIARHRAADFHRSRRPTADLPDQLASGDQAGDDADARIILDIIRTLPGAYRETLLLRLAEGLSGPEIAERTGLTPASVRVNLHRGMAMLRERLGGGSHA